MSFLSPTFSTMSTVQQALSANSESWVHHSHLHMTLFLWCMFVDSDFWSKQCYHDSMIACFLPPTITIACCVFFSRTLLRASSFQLTPAVLGCFMHYHLLTFSRGFDTMSGEGSCASGSSQIFQLNNHEIYSSYNHHCCQCWCWVKAHAI